MEEYISDEDRELLEDTLESVRKDANYGNLSNLSKSTVRELGESTDLLDSLTKQLHALQLVNDISNIIGTDD